MCGIFGYIGRGDATEIVFNGLKQLEYRGYDSWGVASLVGDTITVSKDIGFLPRQFTTSTQSQVSIGHTRWATHGGVTVENAHPHLSCDGRVAVVHNGILENYSAIKHLLPKSHQYKSQTDTEIISHYLEDQLRVGKSILSATKSLVKNMKGLNALVVMDTHAGEVVAYRYGSPLVLGKNTDGIYISSDLPTLSQNVDSVYALSDHEVLNLSSDLSLLSWVKAPRNNNTSAKLTSKYHMEQEIFSILELLKDRQHLVTSELKNLEHEVKKSSDIVMTGCGSAYHACLFGQIMLASRGITTRALIASEGDFYLPTIHEKTLVIVISQSGETIDSVQFANACKQRGARVLCITNVEYSTLDRLSDISIHLNTGVEVAVASTKAYFFMLHVFCALMGNSTAPLIAKIDNLFKPTSIRGIKRLAKSIIKLDKLFVLGRGLFSPLALETALKFKEIGYLHAEAFSAGELKHGTLALITSGSVCLIFTDNDSPDPVVSEIEARGGKVIIIRIPDLGELSTLYGTVYSYLLSYHFSVLRGNNPDRPRNLAKSVTVK